jgi:hypothetical protein
LGGLALCRHSGWSTPVGLCVQQLADERRRFVASELACSLTLGEAHWATCIAEIGMAGLLQEGQQFSYLL